MWIIHFMTLSSLIREHDMQTPVECLFVGQTSMYDVSHAHYQIQTEDNYEVMEL